MYQIQAKLKRPAMYGSCTFNNHEQNYGQPKTEVYGVYRALKELRHRIWGVHFRLDHDAKSLAKMLLEPDDVPNAPLLRWVSWCRLFDFETNHVPATQFRVEDALSRRPPAPEDSKYTEPDTEDFSESYLNLVYGIQNPIPKGANLDSATKYLLESTYFRLTSPYDTSWSANLQIPLLWPTQAVHMLELEPGTRVSQPVKADEPYSLFRSSTLRYVSEFDTRALPEFHIWKVSIISADKFLLGDELVSFEFNEWVSYSQSIPLDELSSRVGHQHGQKDRDGNTYWSMATGKGLLDFHHTEWTADGRHSTADLGQ